MPFEFHLPDVGEGVAEGELVAWHVQPGDTVTEDQVLAEVETDKALVDVPSPVNGTVRELRAEAGDVVPVGDVLITFDLEDEAESEEEEAGDTATSDDADEEPASLELNLDEDLEGVDGADAEGGDDGSAEEVDEAATEMDADEATEDDDGGAGRVFAAPSARRLARELDVDIAAVDGSGPGGRVTERDVRAAAEGGDEGATEPDVQVGDDATGTEPVDAGGDGAESGGETQPAASGGDGADGDGTTAAAGGEPTPAADFEPADRDRTLATPATRRVADELGVDVDDVPTDQLRDGEPFVDEAAVREYAEAQQAAQAADAAELAAEGTDEAATAEGGMETPADAATGDADATSSAAAGDAGADTTAAAGDETERERREPYRGVRKTIGEQMERSKFTAPHVTHHDRVDVTELVEARERLKPRAEERGIKLTYVPFVLKAVVAALQQHPDLNTALDEDNEEIVYRNYYNVGVATATEAGLMVPVVEDVDRKGLLQLASEVNELVGKARERSIAREEMQGGTFTITNFGAVGGEYATPIINYPETAILGLGAIKDRPWIVDGDVVPRKVMTLSLSIDHRVIDGAEAAAFTNTLMEFLEDPTLLLLE